MRAAHATLVGEVEDPLRARVDRLVHRMTKARHLAAGVVDRLRHLFGDAAGHAARAHDRLRVLE